MAASQISSSLPSGFRLYVVGDIHGRADLLGRLMTAIETDIAAHRTTAPQVVFLGDYVDRGVDSKGVLDKLLEITATPMTKIFLRGNHDELMLQFVKGDDDCLPVWLSLGGTATLASYGISPYRNDLLNDPAALRDALSEALPFSHLAFLDSTQFSYSMGDYYFVHAGVRPERSLEAQHPEDQIWIRGEFLSSQKNFGKIVVHGHTISPTVEVLPNRIGIDTGAYATGRLTCLVLEGAERSFLTA